MVGRHAEFYDVLIVLRDGAPPRRTRVIADAEAGVVLAAVQVTATPPKRKAVLLRLGAPSSRTLPPVLAPAHVGPLGLPHYTRAPAAPVARAQGLAATLALLRH